MQLRQRFLQKRPTLASFIFTRLGFCIAIFSSANALAAKENITGKVVYVDDGDTVVLLASNNEQMKIRLSSIDAPESSHTNKERGRISQPYSQNSGDLLKTLVKGKSVLARCFEKDKYGRFVCELFVDGKSVNDEMVKQGYAWANVAARGRYLRNKDLVRYEAEARSKKLGLWAGRNPVAPWEWRDRCWKQSICTE